MADLKDTYVVHGACTTCTCGMRKSRTVLEKSHGVFLKDRALMTVNDCKPENIICFGGCYSMENPDTAAEAQKIQMDVEKDCPNTFTDTVMNFFAKKDQKESSDAPLRVVGICTPKIISAEWDNGGNTVEVNGEVPLLAGAKVYCLYGGEIEIIDSGQPEAGDMSQVEISPHSVPLSGSPGSNAESAAMGAAAAGLAAISGMPKQAVAGMIGASKASNYGKSKTSDVERAGDLVSKLQLEDFFTQIGHFQANAVTDTMVKDLNRMLEKYEINTPEKIAMFMATIGHESKTALVEGGVGNTYVVDGVDYRGGGYSQITGYKFNYKPFAEQMEKEGLVALSSDGSNPITSIGGGAEYVAKNFAWEAAGWHWTAQGNIINTRIDRGEDFYKVSQVINGGPSYTGTPNGWNERNHFYGIAQNIFK
ncbi:PAAR-like protein [Lacrimispora sp. BS-2]|uniref:PAAR-like protein n=1 Tax=Lacrimispora sp. BS-2 TaxID=3151850 RepID=A0AAU7PK83_9FIRM